MPTTVNGVGTHYYGKRNLSQRTGVCQSCKGYGTLVSYDTRLWFVILFIPIIPLGRKRIMDECPRCRRHFVADADKYEANKQLQVSGSMDEYRRDPSPENALRTHASLMAFRDFDQAEEFRRSATGQFPEHAGLHAGLAGQLEHFSSFHAATPLLERALELDPDLPDARVGVARRRMAEGKLDEARELLDFLELPGAGRQYSLEPLDVLSTYYQKAGRHQEALEIAAHLLREVPEAGQQHTFRAFVKKSEKATGALESILPPVEGGFRGLFKGSDSPHPGWVRKLFWTGIVGGLLAAGLFASNESIRRNRTVHVVNATGKPVQVRIDGGPPVPVSGLGKIAAAEGHHRVEIDGPTRETVELDVTSGFLSRWFNSPVWVINPGKAAVLDEETVYYAANPTPSNHQLIAGRSVIEVQDIDYAFVEPPQHLQVKGADRVVTKRVLRWLEQPADDLFSVLRVRNSKDEAMGFAENQLRSHPEDEPLLREYVQQIADGQAARVETFLLSGLDRRPVSVSWHRAYQSAAQALGKREEVVARYDRALAAEPSNAPLLYLRGRLELTFPRSEPFFQRARDADPKLGWPWFALGMHARSEGRWDDCLVNLRKARELGISEDSFQNAFHIARLGRGEAGALVGEYRNALAANFRNIPVFIDLADAMAVDGQADRIPAELNAWLSKFPVGADDGGLRSSMRALAFYQAGKLDEAEKAAATNPALAAGPLGAHIKLAAGKGKEIADRPEHVKAWEDPWATLTAAVELNLEGEKEKSQAFRSRAQKAMAIFGDLFLDARQLLTVAEAPSVADVMKMSIDPDNKTLILCDLAARFPAKRGDYLAEAARLNILRKPPYLVVKRAVDRGTAPKKP